MSHGPSVTVQRSNGTALRNLTKSLAALRKTDVLIGIPQNKTQRKGDEIDNASLLFVLSHGSPLHNIPPTPIIEPGVQKSKALWSPELAAAAKAMLERRPQQVTLHLRRAGTIAVNACKRMFTDNDWPPNAPSTIARKDPKRWKKFIAGKITFADLADGVRRNIATGQLRRAITFVFREGEVETVEQQYNRIEAEDRAWNESGQGAARPAGFSVEEAVTLGGEAAVL